jgi:hypothetical protein
MSWRKSSTVWPAGLGFTPENHPRLRFLPLGKAAAVHRINADYERMQARLANESGGLRLPSDEEKFRLLKEERHRDLAALLTSEELRAYEARFPRDAEMMRQHGPRGDVLDSPLHRELRAVIGEERFREYLRDRDPRYQRL